MRAAGSVPSQGRMHVTKSAVPAPHAIVSTNAEQPESPHLDGMKRAWSGLDVKLREGSSFAAPDARHRP